MRGLAGRRGRSPPSQSAHAGRDGRPEVVAGGGLPAARQQAGGRLCPSRTRPRRRAAPSCHPRLPTVPYLGGLAARAEFEQSLGMAGLAAGGCPRRGRGPPTIHTHAGFPPTGRARRPPSGVRAAAAATPPTSRLRSPSPPRGATPLACATGGGAAAANTQCHAAHFLCRAPPPLLLPLPRYYYCGGRAPT